MTTLPVFCSFSSVLPGAVWAWTPEAAMAATRAVHASVMFAVIRRMGKSPRKVGVSKTQCSCCSVVHGAAHCLQPMNRQDPLPGGLFVKILHQLSGKWRRLHNDETEEGHACGV
jgi:hypothetical protein